MVVMDHRLYVININLEEYFQDQNTSWDEINKIVLNPSRRSYREQFCEYLKKLIEAYKLEEQAINLG